MLHYFVRYLEVVKMNLWVSAPRKIVPLIELEDLVLFNCNKAFDARMEARREA